MTVRTRLVRPLLAAATASATALGGGVAAGAATVPTTATGTSAHTASATSTATNEDGKLLLMLDASGSMKEKDPSGGTKMDAAKKALTEVVDELPEDTNVGLRVYGATEEGGRPTKAACADTQLAAPIEPLDQGTLKKAIKGFTAKGETPIAHSLKKGLDDLGSQGKRNIVLVSDGEESCTPDPCPTIKKLVNKGVDLRIDTVGFDVRGTARKQLQCIADAGEGTYYDAKDADELTTSLNKISTRAVRDFAFTGKPVTGTDLTENEQPPADLPTLTPGLWTDELTTSEDTWRAYSVERTQENSTLHVSATTKPKKYYNDENDVSSELEKLNLKVHAQDGTECISTFGHAGENSQGLQPVATVSGRLHGQTPEADTDDRACRAKGKFTVVINREGAQQTTPAEIQVIEEPRVTTMDDLPAAVEDYPKEIELKKKGKAQPVTGGLSFSNAPEITEGTWVDTLVPGETLVYRVKVEDGQTARFTANGPTGGFRFPEGHELDTLWVDGSAFGPDRQEVGDSSRIAGSFSEQYGSSPKSVVGAPVRYKNRYAPTYATDNLSGSSMSGWYYYAVGIGAGDLGQALTGQPIKVAFTVDIEGKPSHAVTYAGNEDWDAAATREQKGESDEADATASPAKDGGGSALPRIGGGLLVAIVLAAGAWFGMRRKGSGQSARSQE